MHRSSLLAAFLLLVGAACPALAQSFPKPPDVPAYVQVNATYASGTTQNILGDGSDAKGGTPPAFASQLTNIPTPSRSSWLTTGTWTAAGNDYCIVGVETDQFGNPCTEPKFRTHVEPSHVLFDDPIRNYGQPGASHCHTFFGNRFANAYSTYASLRTRRGSKAAGGQLNATGYWFPCVVLTNPFGDGKNYAAKPNYMVVYYNTISASNAPKVQRLPRGFRYVFGYNMDDPDDTQAKKEIAAANAQPGTAGRYTYFNNGIAGWRCAGGSNAATNTFVRYLKNDAGTDQWQASVGATCASGTIEMTLSAPTCWDGTNLWSPGGYKHLRYEIQDSQSPTGFTCPNGWYRLPTLQILFVFSESGTADYTRWRLSSDDMAATKLNSLPTCSAGYANAPCNDGGGTRTVRNGESFHTDWLGAWDDTTMVAWQTNCLGLLGASNQHQCPPSIISGTEALTYTPLPDGTSVATTHTYGTGSASNMYLIGTVHQGPATVHHHN